MTSSSASSPSRRAALAAIVILLCTCLASVVTAAPKSGKKKGNSQYTDYIERFAPLAIEQMKQAGIPASITLAQGLLESSAGMSTLAREGNNHFGIKCGNWTGPSMLRDDDAPDECFRVYSSAAESYADHSRILKAKRYKRLFDLAPGDYAGWARGLSECGYATDPNYADRLVTIIELYGLTRYDSGAADANDVVQFIFGALQSTHAVRRSRSLHYVVAAPGDTYLAIAREFNMKVTDLLRYNDTERDGEIKAWEEVYLQEKHKDAPAGHKKVTIGEGESMHSIAQRFGMQLSTLRRLNPKAKDRPGTVLSLH